MFDVNDIHATAQKYLDKLQNTGYSSNLVVLKKESNPPYFYGFKPSGRPVFTHDLKIARVFKVSCPTLDEHANHLKGVGLAVDIHPAAL